MGHLQHQQKYPMTHACQTLLVDTTRGVRTLTLNRPAVRNAMSAQMVHELMAALAQAEADAQAGGATGADHKVRAWCCAAPAATSAPVATSATWPRPA